MSFQLNSFVVIILIYSFALYRITKNLNNGQDFYLGIIYTLIGQILIYFALNKKQSNRI